MRSVSHYSLRDEDPPTEVLLKKRWLDLADH
jgi:hypothetical protein